jgi:hypothetical protein
MSAEIKKEIQLEIAHVLFIDIVGSSKLSISDQHAAIEELNQIVRASEQFQRAEAASRLPSVRQPGEKSGLITFHDNIGGRKKAGPRGTHPQSDSAVLTCPRYIGRQDIVLRLAGGTGA